MSLQQKMLCFHSNSPNMEISTLKNNLKETYFLLMGSQCKELHCQSSEYGCKKLMSFSVGLGVEVVFNAECTAGWRCVKLEVMTQYSSM